jgi:hypothetical protein
MQNTTGVAVVATQLAGTDRRALSEAWYRALHLAEPPAPALRAAVRPPFAAARTAGAPAAAGALRERSFGAAAPAGRGAGRAGAAASPAGRALERREPHGALARRLERALRRRLPLPACAQFAVAAAGGRVQLLVRTDAGRTRVVALCVPALRESVTRALAHARFALAGSGVRCEVA